MKVYRTNEEVKADIQKGVLKIKGDVKFECDVKIDAHIEAGNIEALNIEALNINAGDINAGDIEARNIEALNIEALNIDARDIDARNIDYYAFCIVYNNVKCKSIRGKRNNSFHKCLDGKLTIKEKVPEIEITVKINGKKAKLSDISEETWKQIKEN